MKKAVAGVMTFVMMLALSATSFAAGGRLTLEEAKQTALARAGVNASEANFTKAYQNWDDGREVYEIEFYVNGTEYDMDVDVLTGNVTDFSMDYHGGYNYQAPTGTQQGYNTPAPVNPQPSYGYNNYGYYDDWDDRYDDWDDRYDYDYDDMYDRYDYDYDDMYDWDD